MRFAKLAIAVLVAAGATQASAQQYPTRPVTMVVPFAAGGPTDTVARLTAEAMAKDLGHPVVVENVAGAGGTLASRRVAQAQPDGYTLLIHHIGISTAPSLYRQLPFKTLEAFAPIGLVTDAPMTIIARPDFPSNSLSELIAYAKEKKDGLTYANSGLGAASHLCGMLFMSSIGVQMTTVPYKGNGPIMTDLMGKQIDLTCDQTTNTAGPIKAGNVKAYAVTTSARVKELPNVPTASEAGLPGFELGVWHGLYTPAGTPPEVISRLVAALQKAVEDDNVKKRFNEIATEPVTKDRAAPEPLRQKLTSEVERWAPIIKAAGQFAD